MRSLRAWTTPWNQALHSTWRSWPRGMSLNWTAIDGLTLLDLSCKHKEIIFSESKEGSKFRTKPFWLVFLGYLMWKVPEWNTLVLWKVFDFVFQSFYISCILSVTFYVNSSWLRRLNLLFYIFRNLIAQSIIFVIGVWNQPEYPVKFDNDARAIMIGFDIKTVWEGSAVSEVADVKFAWRFTWATMTKNQEK